MNILSENKKFINSLHSNQKRIYHKSLTNYVVSNENQTLIDIHAKLLEDRIIFLTGEIDDWMCDVIKAQLLYLEQTDSKSDISIYINSGGGSVYSGLGLLDTIEYIKPDISTINTGLAASMAAVILCSGTKGKRKSLKRSRTMIHQPLGYTGFAQASDMEIEAKQINSLKKELYEIISEKTGQPYEKVSKDGDRDYWMSAQESKKYGMIDEILIKR
jgi:ATP-dependent Clp protease, protease subunit